MTKKERNSFNKQAKAEDLIRAIKNMSCAEEHTATIIQKVDSRLENGLSTNKKKDIDKLSNLHQILEDTTNCRRLAMDLLDDMFKGDKDYWCNVKHFGSAERQCMEVYQADYSDMKAYAVWKEANKVFIANLTSFIGEKITYCASCLGDMLSE